MGLRSLSLTSAQSVLDLQKSQWLILFRNERNVRNVRMEDRLYLKAAKNV